MPPPRLSVAVKIWIELSGGAAQVQAAVQGALETIGRKVAIYDEVGGPAGETRFNVQPSSFLVIGTSGEFVMESGINESKFHSFEVYRQHTREPDIITFDEFLHRARFIVEHGEMLNEVEAIAARWEQSAPDTA